MGLALSGCGGSSVWEKPDHYKNPKISGFKLIEKKKEAEPQQD